MYRPFPPLDHVDGGRHVATEISGRDRHLFFKRPVVPLINPNQAAEQQFVHPTPPTITRAHGVIPAPLAPVAATTKRAGGSRGGAQSGTSVPSGTMASSVAAALGETQTKTVMCQTDFRENECQTDPYTPDYYVEDGKNPEVLAIMTLKYGEGLPAGLAEVEMIDRVQRRKKVETGLPQGSDDASMQKRLEQLEELEQLEWNEREDHIKELQEERLQQMDDALQKREAEREQASAKRIALVKEQKEREQAKTMEKLKARRQKDMRQLEAIHSNPTKQMTKRDIIADYSKHGLRGKGIESKSLVEKVSSTNYDVRPTLLGFAEGVQELERTEAPRVQRVRKKDLQPPEEITMEDLQTNFRKREARQVKKDLEFANETIIKSKQGPVGTTSIQDLYRATPRLIRPDTPTLVLQGDEEEEREEALILLQRLLRGRSVQNDFFEGKERCHGLIEELQAAQKAKETEGKYLQEVEAEKFKAKQEKVMDGIADSIQGGIVYSTMDYLAKELIRQREAATFERLRLEAETTRREREEAEKRRRAQEEKLRAREDAQFRQIQKINDYTIHTYLTGMIGTCIDDAAYDKALNEQLDVMAEERRQSGTASVSNEDEVCDLMLNFVIPQVHKEQMKTKSAPALVERATLAAAEIALQSAIGDVATTLKEG